MGKFELYELFFSKLNEFLSMTNENASLILN